MADGFRYHRRVQFAETDQVGIVHFSNYFRYMEEAEHALWRAAGLTIAKAGESTGWPRVAASFDYRSALRFEDEFEVEVRLESVSSRRLTYAFTLRKDALWIGSGTITIVHVAHEAEGMRATALPPDVVDRLAAIAGPPQGR